MCAYGAYVDEGGIGSHAREAPRSDRQRHAQYLPHLALPGILVCATLNYWLLVYEALRYYL
jgi:hypothetical protein